jgi:putative acetyltransferase
MLAEDAGAAVGFILLTPATVEGATVRLLSLAPLGVASSHQREGVGSGLVRRSLELARERGVEAVVVLGHPRYYPRFGFTPALGWGLTPTNPVPDAHADAWMVCELVPGALSGVSGRVLMMPPLDDPLYW